MLEAMLFPGTGRSTFQEFLSSTCFCGQLPRKAGAFTCKSFLAGEKSGEGAVPGQMARGQRLYVLSSEPKEITHGKLFAWLPTLRIFRAYFLEITSRGKNMVTRKRGYN